MYAPLSVVAGARGIEPRSKVLETFVLAVVLCPYDWLTAVFMISQKRANVICFCFSNAA